MLNFAPYRITISKAYSDSVDALRNAVQAKELVGIKQEPSETNTQDIGFNTQ